MDRQIKQARKIVDIESPYFAPDLDGVRRNIQYARACVRDSLLRGEILVASHLLYTQAGILDDNVPEERELGIMAGKDLVERAGDMTAVYTDLGVSKGMEFGIEHARVHGRPVEYRNLGEGWGKTTKTHSHESIW